MSSTVFPILILRLPALRAPVFRVLAFLARKGMLIFPTFQPRSLFVEEPLSSFCTYLPRAVMVTTRFTSVRPGRM